MVKRKRGGQLGNLNALKHGFYSRQFKGMELDDLELLKANKVLVGDTGRK